MSIQLSKRRFATGALLTSILSSVSLPTTAEIFEPCTATVDLRTIAAQGNSDTIRVTHQAAAPAPVIAQNLTFRVVRPNGQVLGSFSRTLGLGETAAYTVKQIYDQAGVIATLTPNVIQIVQNDGPPGGPFDMQATYRNYQTGQVVPLVFTCTGPTACGNASKCVFVTSATYQGNLVGLAGADEKCNALASANLLPGTYKAWLSDTTNSPSNRFNQSTVQYKLVDGTVIADNWTDLTDGTIQHQINMDENGNGAINILAWADTTTSGALYDINNSCASWASNSSQNFGWTGSSSYTDTGWTISESLTCEKVAHLYCFQQ